MTPTAKNYSPFDQAYDFFNARLFDGRLPRCLITMQRGRKFYGYFAPSRFGAPEGIAKTDEIAMNPTHFGSRKAEEVLSTLVHEMTHVEQQHFGAPSRAGYHNKEWAGLMRRVGLIPSSTGAPGGKETGQAVSHYIAEGGRFAEAVAELMQDGFRLAYVELWSDDEAEAKAKKKNASKTKYCCPSCDANAWAKPGANLICGDCDEQMQAELAED